MVVVWFNGGKFFFSSYNIITKENITLIDIIIFWGGGLGAIDLWSSPGHTTAYKSGFHQELIVCTHTAIALGATCQEWPQRNILITFLSAKAVLHKSIFL